jgi:hypothetical protein
MNNMKNINVGKGIRNGREYLMKEKQNGLRTQL